MNDIQTKWVEAYLCESKDPHALFANVLGVTRQEAKAKCYEIIHSSTLLRNILNENKEE